MIKTDFTEACQKCTIIEVEAKHRERGFIGGTYKMDTYITCKFKEICKYREKENATG